MRKLRAGQSVDQKGAANAKDAAAKKGVRSNQSVEQREAAKAKNASAMRGMRGNQSEEKRAAVNAKDTAYCSKERNVLQPVSGEKGSSKGQGCCS